jgi:hypothetical protein
MLILLTPAAVDVPVAVPCAAVARRLDALCLNGVWVDGSGSDACGTGTTWYDVVRGKQSASNGGWCFVWRWVYEMMQAKRGAHGDRNVAWR